MLLNIKSKFILQKILKNISKKKYLEINKYNKKIQKQLDLNINDYIEFSELNSSIEIEIIPVKNKTGKFINVPKNFEKYYHIYFNNNKEIEIKQKKFS